MKYITKAFPIAPPPKTEAIDSWLNGLQQAEVVGYVQVNNFIVITVTVVDSGLTDKKV